MYLVVLQVITTVRAAALADGHRSGDWKALLLQYFNRSFTMGNTKVGDSPSTADAATNSCASADAASTNAASTNAASTNAADAASNAATDAAADAADADADAAAADALHGFSELGIF